MIAHLQHHATDARLYSNRPAGVYLLTGIQPLLHLPAWWPWTSPLTDSDCFDHLTAFSNRAGQSESRKLQIAWFDELRRGDARFYCDIPALASGSSELELVEEFPDGAIYRFEPST